MLAPGYTFQGHTVRNALIMTKAPEPKQREAPPKRELEPQLGFEEKL